MSDGDNDLFARWSRRKRAARSIEARSSDEEAQAAGAAAAGADADLQLPEMRPPASEPLESVPSIENLTADGDLSAFLREGVPTALKNAAMRKMWALDPAICDYVGPAEYAWDFNQPGSMAGFGPLEAGKSVADFLSKMSSPAGAGSETADTAADAPAPASPPMPRPTAVTSEQPASASPAETVQRPDRPSNPQHSAGRLAAAGDSAEETDLAQTFRTSAAPRHGGALPR